MPEWPGGPCPVCGEDMPARIVHCRTCRSLLNPDLSEDSVVIPTFIPMRELDSRADMTPRGMFLQCPHCHEELRINSKYIGETVSCKHCEGAFAVVLNDPQMIVNAYYSDCPLCERELRIGKKYAGINVACKFCQGKVKLVV